MNLGMDRNTARLWREAHTMDTYGELTAQWLESRIPSQPGYMPNCGPDDETLPHVEVLAAINRVGYITDCSQPGIDCIGYDGARWRQRAAVTGFIASDALIDDLAQRARAAGLEGLALKPLATRGSFKGIEVTRRKNKPFTIFGGPRDLDELMPFHGGSHRLVRTLWHDCFEVVMFDPVWGRNDRLWPVLAAFADAMASRRKVAAGE